MESFVIKLYKTITALVILCMVNGILISDSDIRNTNQYRKILINCLNLSRIPSNLFLPVGTVVKIQVIYIKIAHNNYMIKF